MTNEEITTLFYLHGTDEDVARLRRVDGLVTALVQGRPLNIIAEQADAFYGVAEKLDDARIAYLKRWGETSKHGKPSPIDSEKTRAVIMEKLPLILTPEQKTALRTIVKNVDALVTSVTPEQYTGLLTSLPPAVAAMAMRDFGRARDMAIGVRETILSTFKGEEDAAPTPAPTPALESGE